MSISKLLKISDELLENLAKKIKPVVRFVKFTETKKGYITKTDGGIESKIYKIENYMQLPPAKTPEYFKKGDLYYIKNVDLRSAFLWNPDPIKKAEGLVPYKEVITYHEFLAPAIFRPTIAEVLAQIAKEDLTDVVAFEIVDLPLEECFFYNELDKRTYHVARTILYKEAASFS